MIEVGNFTSERSGLSLSNTAPGRVTQGTSHNSERLHKRPQRATSSAVALRAMAGQASKAERAIVVFSEEVKKSLRLLSEGVKRNLAASFTIFCRSKKWWRWRESNPRVDTVQNRSLHAYFVIEFAYRPVGPPANKRTFRTIPSEISPGPGRKKSKASTINDIACRLLCLDGATWREIKPPEQTLRSQLFVRSVFYEANDHPRYAANFLTEPVESGTPPDKEVVNRNANGSRLYLLI